MPDRQMLLRHSSSVEQVTDMSAFEDALRERICHWYPPDPRYRLSGRDDPQIGDLAYCGYIKEIPYTGGSARHWPQCPQCLRLMRIKDGGDA